MNSTLIAFTSGIADYLLFASIIAATLVTIVWLIIKLAKIRAPVYHHMIWLYTLFVVFILPVIWVYAPKLPLPVLPAQPHNEISITQQIDLQPPAIPLGNRPFEIQSSDPKASPVPVVITQNQHNSIPVKRILACLWSVGFLFMLTRLFIGWHRIKRMVRSAEPFKDDMLPQLLSPLRRSRSGVFLKYWIPAFHLRQSYGGQVAGMTKSSRIRLLLSPHVDSPLCFGVLRPVILLPKQMYNNNIPEDLEMVLSHELAHIERKDCVVNIFQRLVEAIFFFHPFVWYASSQLTQNREILCDHHVIAKGASPTDYVRMLTRIIEQGFEKNSLHAVALFEGKLLSRIRSMLTLGNKIRLKASRWAMIAGAAVILLSMASGAIRLEAKSSMDNSQESIQSQSIKSTTVKETISEESIGNNWDAITFRSQEERLAQGDKRPISNCSISGNVVSAETGEPVAHADVYLFYKETDDLMVIRVASDGSFEFKDIPKGPFSLTAADTSGFFDADYNPENSDEEFPLFSLEEGEKRSGIIFRLKPTYTISGTVWGENGQPIEKNRFRVRALVEMDEPGEDLNRYRVVGSTRISLDGSYMFERLDLLEYLSDNTPVYLMVTENSPETEDRPLPPCYYPGVISRDKAEKIYFGEKKSLGNMDIRLTSNEGSVLEGIVTDEKTGDPIPKTLITVHHSDMLFGFLTAYTDARGYYRIEGLDAGDFLVHIDAKPWGYVRTRKPVTIGKAETTRLDVTLRSAAIISGRFINEDGEPLDLFEYDFHFSYPLVYGLAYRYDYPYPDTKSYMGTTNKYATVEMEEVLGTYRFNAGQGDYEEEYMVFPSSDTFLIEGILPGKTMLQVNFYSKEEGGVVKQILYNGQDITETGIETRPGEKIEGVNIVIDTENNLLLQSKKDILSIIQQLDCRKANGYIGVSIQSVPSYLKVRLGLKDTNGALVVQVAENSPAAKAGIQIGDVIISFDGREIKEAAKLSSMVRATTTGNNVKVDVLRNGEKKTFDLQVGEVGDL